MIEARDLWEWVLKVAILLFVFDVGVRRIQLDGEEFAKAFAAVRRRIFFWQKAPAPQQTDESLAALLTRRDEVRSRKIEPQFQMRPSSDGLFSPKKAPESIAMKNEKVFSKETETKAAVADEKPAEPENTTSRLLEAKRRARKNLE